MSKNTNILFFYDFCNNPEDPHNIEQYYLDKINANAACEYYYPYSTTNDRTVVAVIDQPIYINHEDLIGNSSNNHCDASTINEFESAYQQTLILRLLYYHMAHKLQVLLGSYR